MAKKAKSKVETVSAEEAVVSNDGKKYLTKEEILQIQQNAAQIKLCSQASELEETRLKLLEQQVTILQLRLQAEMESLKKKLDEKRVQMDKTKADSERAKQAAKHYMSQLATKYELEEGKAFGYDPDTYEIVIN